MSASLIRGRGATNVTLEIQLLDPNALGSGSFWYDFWLEASDAAGAGRWQIWTGAAYEDMPGSSDVTDGNPDVIWRVEVDATSEGKVQVERTAGNLSYGYGICGPGYPSVERANGVLDASGGAVDREILLRKGEEHVFNASGDFGWYFWDGVGWAAYGSSSESGFVGMSPPSGRVMIRANTGDVEYEVTRVGVES